MTNLSETSLSLLASAPLTSSTTNKVLFGIFVLTLALCAIYYASSMRLTRFLVATFANAENMYLEALEAGVLSNSDVHTAEMMSRTASSSKSRTSVKKASATPSPTVHWQPFPNSSQRPLVRPPPMHLGGPGSQHLHRDLDGITAAGPRPPRRNGDLDVYGFPPTSEEAFELQLSASQW
ncbi:hypothetical protein DFH09DRAFT_1105765 [Mycena vulgaris]|nr:hypothetical protein DFH09DRAFT_1105765 [Mycena vulgaris]